MPALPSTLALTTIQTSAQILSADHRNNYSAVQTGWNSLIGILDDGVTGQVLAGVGSTLTWVYPPGYEYAYAEFTASVTVAGTAEGSATSVVSAAAVTFDGATNIEARFACPAFTVVAGHTLHIVLYDATSAVGELTQIINNTAVNIRFPGGTFPRRLTPSAASHTYNVKAWASAATTDTVDAGTGGTGVLVPGHIRLVKV